MSRARHDPAAPGGATLSGAAASGASGLPAVWGATDEEVAAPFPCDDLLGVPHEAWFRAVDVGAPAVVAFRWLCQLKVAPYSYDMIDNFGRRSPRALVPGADDLAVGQWVMTMFRLTDFVAGESLTMVLDRPRALALFGELALSYVVVPRDEASCRMVVKMLVAAPRGPCAQLRRRALGWGDLAMMRRQLLTLKHLAESTPSEPGMAASATA